MMISKDDIRKLKIEQAVVELVGTYGYRVILVLTSLIEGYPIIKVHAFQTQIPYADPLLVIRDLSDGFLTTVAEVELLHKCKPIVDVLLNAIIKKDRRTNNEKDPITAEALNFLLPH